MTAQDLISHCKTFEAEHGIMALLDILESITMCQAQAAGVDLLDMDEDDDVSFHFVTMQ